MTLIRFFLQVVFDGFHSFKGPKLNPQPMSAIQYVYTKHHGRCSLQWGSVNIEPFQYFSASKRAHFQCSIHSYRKHSLVTLLYLLLILLSGRLETTPARTGREDGYTQITSPITGLTRREETHTGTRRTTDVYCKYVYTQICCLTLLGNHALLILNISLLLV